MVYRSKRGVLASIISVAGVLLIVVGLGLAIPVYLQEPPWPIMLLFPLAAVLGAVMVWLSRSTWYEITGTALVARAGPFRKTIALAAIQEVDPEPSLFRPAWGFALSVDRVLIKYRTASGREALLPIAISPEDKATFLEGLTKARAGGG
jgi:hypothetical protein